MTTEDNSTRKGEMENSNNNINFFKSIFFFNNKSKSNDDDSPRISLLSPLANSVVSRCSKILQVPTEKLQHSFETDLPDNVKQHSSYAKNFLEFCSYQALHRLTADPDYLTDKEFRRLTYDMMLAWEAPGVENEALDAETTSCSDQGMEGEDGWSLFYSSSTKTAVQVDNKKTVGPEAFARIAPACAVIADIITVHNLFDSLTSSSCHRLHFLIYDKYLRTLEKVIKAVKNAMGSQSTSNLPLADGEFILDVDGTVPTQPVLQHIGISAWPGRLTLTNYALYFESLGVGLYDKAVRYDLEVDMKQVIRPDLTGPLGARLFDKAVMYKSTSIVEPVYLEFPEFKGNSRRDYWLDVCLEILRVHRFIRKYNLKGIQQSEALGRAILGIFRYRAARDAFGIFSSHYKTLLCFNLAESLPGGDTILETLSSCLAVCTSQCGSDGVLSAKQGIKLPGSVLTLHRLGISEEGADFDGEAKYAAIDVCVGEINPLEMAVKQSQRNTGRAEAAQATVDEVKVEGIDTNLAVMKELLFPLIESFNRLQVLASWKDPWKSTAFLVLTSCIIYRGWIRYILPSIFVILAVIMLWHRHVNKGRPLEAFKITIPPNKNAVEQLLTLQEAITQVESLVQAGNIVLLKVRALLIAALPQATDRVAVLLVFVAVLLALASLRHLILLVFLEAFTREMPLRKASSDKWLRRIREWWVRIPAAPVHLIKADDKKRK
ncbi:FT-interacting protein [Actinidia chinensis var. chinensis]|uniref:FT-interacting protein n=1 Tax=Actinidia chinensis var. chinensis TaxID=1590841 RepID=A0A2R6PBD6_ACTCC|nr:FT-interacting protein [Actinidia chinensis var. chinensis]